MSSGSGGGGVSDCFLGGSSGVGSRAGAALGGSGRGREECRVTVTEAEGI